ncbi:MAG: hypothetical protein ACXWC9_03715 [Pseudobdellovibrionaceae bacterium]
MTNSSESSVSYDYANRYSGSLSPPGVSISDKYLLTSASGSIFPSVRLLYATPFLGVLVGYSVFGTYRPRMLLGTDKFDFPQPTSASDRPLGFSMTTIIQPTFDLGFSIEPGVPLSNDSLLFLRFAYHQMDAEIKTLSSIQTGLSSWRFNEVSKNHHFEGAGAGIGLKFLYSANIAIESLLEYYVYKPLTVEGSSLISYNDEVTVSQIQEVSLKWNVFSLAVSFRF